MTGVTRLLRPAELTGKRTLAEMSRFPFGLNFTPTVPSVRFRLPGFGSNSSKLMV